LHLNLIPNDLLPFQKKTMESTDITCLTHTLLENNPQQYLEILNNCINNKTDVSEQINSKEYDTWYSNHLSCLSYLVGDLKKSEHDENGSPLEFYGYNTSISNDLGIEIMNCLIDLGIDKYDKNYYDETVFDSIKHDNNYLCSRINNEEFKRELNSYQALLPE